MDFAGHNNGILKHTSLFGLWQGQRYRCLCWVHIRDDNPSKKSCTTPLYLSRYGGVPPYNLPINLRNAPSALQHTVTPSPLPLFFCWFVVYFTTFLGLVLSRRGYCLVLANSASWIFKMVSLPPALILMTASGSYHKMCPGSTKVVRFEV